MSALRFGIGNDGRRRRDCEGHQRSPSGAPIRRSCAPSAAAPRSTDHRAERGERPVDSRAARRSRPGSRTSGRAHRAPIAPSPGRAGNDLRDHLCDVGQRSHQVGGARRERVPACDRRWHSAPVVSSAAQCMHNAPRRRDCPSQGSGYASWRAGIGRRRKDQHGRAGLHRGSLVGRTCGVLAVAWCACWVVRRSPANLHACSRRSRYERVTFGANEAKGSEVIARPVKDRVPARDRRSARRCLCGPVVSPAAHRPVHARTLGRSRDIHLEDP